MEEVSLHLGGCAANTATWLVRLGLRTSVMGKVGHDAFGDFVLGALDSRGVDRRSVLRDPRSPTSTSVVLVDPAGERTFLHLPGADGTLTATEIGPEVLSGARAVHVGGALVMPALDGEPLAGLLKEARLGGLQTSVDTVWDPTGGWARIQPCLPYVDIFFASMAEAAAITGMDDPERAASWLRRKGAGEVALKLGADGSYLQCGDFSGYVPAVPVDVVDGTGAGDAFVAAYLFARQQGRAPVEAGRLANAAGAWATTTVGASDHPARAEQLLSWADAA